MGSVLFVPNPKQDFQQLPILSYLCVRVLGATMATSSEFHLSVQKMLSCEESKDAVHSDDMEAAELLPHHGVVFVTGAGAGNQELVHRITHEMAPLP